MTNERRFYVYAYLREDGTPYYIGRGTRDRINSREHSCALPIRERRVKLLEGLTNDEVNHWEKTYIAFYGRKDNGTGILRNLTDGGDGICGFVFGEETRAKMSEVRLGREPADGQMDGWLRSNDERSEEARLKYGVGKEQWDDEFDRPRMLRVQHLLRQGNSVEVALRPRDKEAEYAGRGQTKQRTIAKKYGIEFEAFTAFSPKQKNCIAQRYRRGNRGAELTAGLA